MTGPSAGRNIRASDGSPEPLEERAIRSIHLAPRPVLAVLTILVTSLSIVAPGRAQEPGVGERVQAVGDAFRAIAARSREGQWQEADAAFNGALDAVDAHRPPLEAALGPAASAAFDAITTLQRDLIGALDAEDAAGVQAVVSLIESRLAGLAPGMGLAAPPRAATDAVRRWRDARGGILTLAEAGQWRDMRNVSEDLVADIERRAEAIAAPAGPDGPRLVKEARVFAMRLLAAALDQSLADAVSSAEHFDEALDGLLVALGALPSTAATPDPEVRAVFRAWQVSAVPGEIVVVPIVGENIPQVGLGSYRLLARWSPAAMALVDVTSDLGQVSVVRDDTVGSVEIALPQAPTGPAGDRILARLRFEVGSGQASVPDYLPAGAWAALESDVADATTLLRRADTPRAAGVLAARYMTLVEGREQRGSLYDALDRYGLAAPLADSLLTLVDLTSRPAEPDLIVTGLESFEHMRQAALDALGAGIGFSEGVPVTIDVLAVTDTRGRPMAVLPSIPGQVIPTRATPSPRGVAVVTVPPASPESQTPDTRAPRDMGGGDSDGGDSGGGEAGDALPLPLPLLGALVAAGVIGVGVSVLVARQGRDQDDGAEGAGR